MRMSGFVINELTGLCAIATRSISTLFPLEFVGGFYQ